VPLAALGPALSCNPDLRILAKMSSIDQLRHEIDALDDQIVKLLNARAQAAIEIGRLKTESGAGVYSPERECSVLEHIAARSEGPLTKDALQAIYRELMSASFALERPTRVGYLGPAGSFSHETALEKFGASVTYEPLSNARGIFDAIARGHVDYGVVPVENNTTGGVVLDTLEALLEINVQICCEIQRAIHQNLLANGALGDIDVVYSKSEAFKQCENWLAERGLAGKLVEAPSTSKAAEMASQTPRAAAVAGALAAKTYGLQVLAANIEDNPKNATRFFVIGKEPAKPTGSDRTGLLFVTAHEPGALVSVLLAFQRHGVSLTTITSRRKVGTSAEFVFFVELDGHQTDSILQRSFADAKQYCRNLRVLGSYPRAPVV